MTLRGRGQTWQALTVAAGAAQSTAPTVQLPWTLCRVNRKLDLHVQRYVQVRQVSGGTHARARKTLPQDGRPGDRSVTLLLNTLPEQEEPGLQTARSGKSRTFAAQTPPQWQSQRVPIAEPADGAMARACFECQARHANVHASSDVLIGERGRARANPRGHLLLRRREPERAQTLARASLAPI